MLARLGAAWLFFEPGTGPDLAAPCVRLTVFAPGGLPLPFPSPFLFSRAAFAGWFMLLVDAVAVSRCRSCISAGEESCVRRVDAKCNCVNRAADLRMQFQRFSTTLIFYDAKVNNAINAVVVLTHYLQYSPGVYSRDSFRFPRRRPFIS